MCSAKAPEPPTPDTSAAPSAPFTAVAPYYDALMASVPYRFWVDYLERLWAHNGQRPETILDLACGTGIVTRLLARRGYHVTGVDIAPAMLEAARRQTQAEGLFLRFEQQDAAELALDRQRFDSTISLFDSLNNILDPARLAAAFGRVCRHLSPGGSFVFDLNTEYALAEGMFNQSCSRKNEPLHYRWRSRYDPETRLCTIHMRFSFDPGDGQRRPFVEIHRQRAYSKEEIVQWLHEAGFTDVFVYDAYSMQPPNKRSDRVFYYAIRPET